LILVIIIDKFNGLKISPMLIDNKHELTRGQETTIFQYLESNISIGGRFDFVTGYFTISALSMHTPVNLTTFRRSKLTTSKLVF